MPENTRKTAVREDDIEEMRCSLNCGLVAAHGATASFGIGAYHFARPVLENGPTLTTSLGTIFMVGAMAVSVGFMKSAYKEKRAFKASPEHYTAQLKNKP